MVKRFIVLLALLLLPVMAFADKPVHAVFLLHEVEYETSRTVPEFARTELEEKLGWKCTFLIGERPNRLPGTEILKDADLLFISVRRQALPESQLAPIRAYCESGKPVVGIRTASHAWTLRKRVPLGGVQWVEFDRDILGGNYHGHYNNKAPDTPRSVIWSKDQLTHPILEGVSREKRITTCWHYQVLPLADTTEVLMWGQYEDNPAEPVAWTNTNIHGGRVYYTSLGHPDDFESEDFRRMLLNGMRWAVGDSASR